MEGLPRLVTARLALRELAPADADAVERLAGDPEVAVAALGSVYAIADAEGTGVGALASTLAAQWSLATALAFLAWYVFAPQCVATLGVVKRETNSWTWPTVMFLYMLGLAYLASFVTYNAARALGWG